MFPIAVFVRIFNMSGLAELCWVYFNPFLKYKIVKATWCNRRICLPGCKSNFKIAKTKHLEATGQPDRRKSLIYTFSYKMAGCQRSPNIFILADWIPAEQLIKLLINCIPNSQFIFNRRCYPTFSILSQSFPLFPLLPEANLFEWSSLRQLACPLSAKGELC